MSPATAPLRDSAFTEAVLRDSPLGIAFVDTDLRVAWANQAFAALTGQPLDDQAGRPLAALLPSVRPTAEDLVREVLESGKPLVKALLTPAATSGSAGATHWRATFYPVRSEARVLIGACCVCTDVTDVVALSNQFLQSQKMESVGLLANIIAHDFNNLLSVIQGYTDLLLRDSSDVAKRAVRLHEIRTAAEAAGHLSRQLLTLSRRNTGALAPVDVNLIVRSIGGVLERLLPANIAHDLILAEGLGLTVADPGQIEQVLMNLITNAIDAMPAGGMLTIETANASRAAHRAHSAGPPSGEYVTLTVTDTGLGMDEATQARLFEPIFTTKDADKGTGLGLSAVRAIVGQLRGDIHFKSALGNGSTFTVFLPRALEPALADEAALAVVPGARTRTVLLVEDHEQLRRTLRVGLEEAGFAVIAARMGSEALHAAAEHSGTIDLLFADFALPDTDGTILAERLRAARPGMRVLISSGFGEQALSPHDAVRRDYAIIGKPFTMRTLVRTIHDTLNAASSANAPVKE